MIRRPTPLAVYHKRASVGEDPFLLTFLHNAGLDRRVLCLWLGAGLADIPEHAVVLPTRDYGFLDGALPRLARVAGFLLLCRRACRLALSSGTRCEGRSGRPFVWRLAAVLSVDLFYIPDRQDGWPVLGSPNYHSVAGSDERRDRQVLGMRCQSVEASYGPVCLREVVCFDEETFKDLSGVVPRQTSPP